MKKEKQSRGQGRIRKNLSLLNPRNLEKEVHMYGYNFSWKSHVLLIICSLLGIGAIGIIFKLAPVYLVIAMAAVFIMLPVLVLDGYKKMYEQKRFSDVCEYMEQMLYAYQKDGKILSALKETREIFEPGQMQDAIDAAIAYLEAGVSRTEQGFVREGLERIEQLYDNTKLRTVHDTLISGEQYGGNIDKAILILLEDIELWKRRGYKLQAQKKQGHTDNIISIVVATILCAVALYVMDGMSILFPAAATDVVIMQVPIIQLSSFLFLLCMLFVLAKSFRSLTSDWLKADGLHSEKMILDSYDNIKHYDEAVEKRKSLLYAAPFLIAAIPVYLFYKKWLAVACLVIGAFMLVQHKVGYNLAKKDVNEELYATLPQWMIQMALLLQHNNVQVSIAKSIESAPVLLREELLQLNDRLAAAPDSLAAYTDFCKDFDAPETQSLMKMLHSIAEAGTGDSDVQISNMLHRVNEMQVMADEKRDAGIAFRMKTIFSYPVLAATVKLLIDLTLGMVYMMSMLGNMGGV